MAGQFSTIREDVHEQEPIVRRPGEEDSSNTNCKKSTFRKTTLHISFESLVILMRYSKNMLKERIISMMAGGLDEQ